MFLICHSERQDFDYFDVQHIYILNINIVYIYCTYCTYMIYIYIIYTYIYAFIYIYTKYEYKNLPQCLGRPIRPTLDWCGQP